MINVRIIGENELIDLRDEWNSLLNNSEVNNISLTWEWLNTWWDVFKDGSRELMVITARDENKTLLGIAPFLIREIKTFFFLPKIKQIEFLGSGEDEADEICSDYLNFIILKGKEYDVISKIIDFLYTDINSKWDEIFLTDMLSTSETTIKFEYIMKELSLRYNRIKKSLSFYIKLPKTWEELLMNLGSEMRYKIRRDRRAISRSGKVTYRKIEDENDLENGLSVLINLHQKRWTEKDKPGVFSSTKFLRFHKIFILLALRNNWLNLNILLINQEPIAIIYNFNFNNKIYFYQSGINTEIFKNISPGLLIHSYCIEDAISKDLREYDFLMGISEYKQRWTKEFREIISFRVHSGNTRLTNTGRIKEEIRKVINF